MHFQEITTNALNLPPTKLNILKICKTFFDPLEILSLIVLQPKFIFKELCNNKYENIKMQWNEFLKDLLTLRAVSVRGQGLCCT